MDSFKKCNQSGCAEKCGKYCWGPHIDMCQTGLPHSVQVIFTEYLRITVNHRRGM